MKEKGLKKIEKQKEKSLERRRAKNSMRKWTKEKWNWKKSLEIFTKKIEIKIKLRIFFQPCYFFLYYNQQIIPSSSLVIFSNQPNSIHNLNETKITTMELSLKPTFTPRHYLTWLSQLDKWIASYPFCPLLPKEVKILEQCVNIAMTNPLNNTSTKIFFKKQRKRSL